MTTNQKKIIWPVDTEPVLSMFRHPKLTILFTLKYKPLSYFIKVGIIGTFASSLVGFLGVQLKGGITLGDVVYSSFITSILMYLISVTLMAVIALFIGAAFGGKAKFKPLFRAFSLTLIPFIWILPILLFWMQLSPNTFFDLSFTNATMVDLLFGIVGPLSLLVSFIWTLIVSLQAIAIVHRFSKWKSFFTLLLMFVTVGVLLMMVQMMTGISLM